MKEFELEPGEHVVIQVRKHWFVFALSLLPYAILALIPLAIPTLLKLAPPLEPLASGIDFSTPLGHAALGVWLLVMWTGAWSSFTRYFLNLWVLTNQRVVEINQRTYFNRQVSSVLLNRVQDVTTDVRGILFSLLGIGTIRVQSAGATNEFDMTGIYAPERMRDLILKYVPENDGLPATSV